MSKGRHLGSTSYVDTGLTAGTTYRYRVRARDAVGNLSGNSIIVTAITGGGPVAGLVAAYGFNEGTGATSRDASGNNNTATLNTATWTTQGRFGGGVSFNGAAIVSVPDAASLDVTTGVTMEAWAFPAVTGGGEYPTLLMKQNSSGAVPTHVYTLHGRAWVSDTGPRLPGLRLNTGTSFPVVSGGSLLAANTWTHVAVTWDGSTMRVYLNGAQVASGAAIGSLVNSSGPLSIGGNRLLTAEYFKGILDEIRIYNRALSVSEIQQDMTTPIGGP